jgi:putative membrane protein
MRRVGRADILVPVAAVPRGIDGRRAMMSGAWGMTIGGWIWMAVWVVALIVMVWLLVSAGNRREIDDDPMEILRGRYARGEMSEEEFRHARDVLA